MRLLADENISGAVVAALREDGHDVAWVRTDAPGSDDGTVLQRAIREKRIILTFDKDFGERAGATGLSLESGVILVRVFESSPGKLAARMVALLRARTDWSGHLSVIEPNRLRMRTLGPRP